MSVPNKLSLDTLFGGNNEQLTANSIVTVSMSSLLSYSKHPFIVKEGKRLNDLIESVREYGILTPLIVREQTKGKYEILAGHHRKEAAVRAGLKEIPCIIRNVDDSTASLIVVDSNKQRGFADMLPSEIAKSLKLEYDALKCQGKRTDLVQELESILNERNLLEKSAVNVHGIKDCGTSAPVGPRLTSSEQLANKTDISATECKRYIRLTYLIPELLNMVDSNKIAIRPAVDISFLKKDEQLLLLNELASTKFKVDMKKAELMKKLSLKKRLDSHMILQIISGNILDKKNKQATAIKLPYKSLSSYVDISLSQKQVEEYIIKALEYYKEHSLSK